jgi:hypothetical protein
MKIRAVLPVLLLLCAGPLTGQSWDELRGLRPGDRVRILDTGGDEQKGTFRAVSDGSISFETNQTEVSIDRARVRRVRVESNSRRLRKALIGAVIGVAVGVTVDQTLGARLRNESNQSGRAVTYIAPIALFGGLGAAFPGYRTVYSAR